MGRNYISIPELPKTGPRRRYPACTHMAMTLHKRHGVLYHQRIGKNQHYSDVIMSTSASQMSGVLIVCWTVCSAADQRKHQSSASLAFVRGIHLWPVNSPHKGPVTRKMLPFHDVIMKDPQYCRVLRRMIPRKGPVMWAAFLCHYVSWTIPSTQWEGGSSSA